MAGLGEIFVSFGVDLAPFKAGMAEVQAQLKAFSTDEMTGIQGAFAKNLNSVGEKLKSIGTGITAGLTLPIVALGVGVLKTGMDFEKEMSNIKAVTGSSSGEMKAFHDLAMQMGKDTSFSAKEAAQGIGELAKAGVSTADILNGGLKSALDLAAAGDLTLAEAAEIASTALNAFKSDNLKVADAANILAGAANASATDVKEMKFGLSMVSSVASAVGMSFKDTSTALAVFAQNGLKGSDAGTSLKTMLMNLAPQQKIQIDEFKKLGLITADGANKFYDASGKLKSLAEVSEILKTSLQNLNPMQRQMALDTMFGADAIRASSILFKEGANGVNEMWQAMSKVTATDTAKEKMNNVSGSVKNLKGTLETLSIQLFDMKSGPIKGFIDSLNQMVQGFMGLDPVTKQIIMVFALIVAAIGPLLMIIGSMATGFAALASAEWLAMLPILAIVVGVGLLIAAIVWCWNTNEGFRKNMMAIWDGLIKNLQPLFEQFSYFMGRLGDTCKALAPLFMWVVGVILSAFANVLPIITTIFADVMKVLNGLLDFITGIFTLNWGRAWNGVAAMLGGIFEGIGHIIAIPLNLAIAAINTLLDGINTITIPGVPKANIPHIPMLAEGGIVSKPTLAMIGEGNEPEAVIPLSKLKSTSKGDIHFNFYNSNIQSESHAKSILDTAFRQVAYNGLGL